MFSFVIEVYYGVHRFTTMELLFHRINCIGYWSRLCRNTSGSSRVPSSFTIYPTGSDVFTRACYQKGLEGLINPFYSTSKQQLQ